jgi:formate C-acetyltransferase
VSFGHYVAFFGGAMPKVPAQQHPEQYKDLLVRVATYSAYFVDLTPMGQQEIIERTTFQGF